LHFKLTELDAKNETNLPRNQLLEIRHRLMEINDEVLKSANDFCIDFKDTEPIRNIITEAIRRANNLLNT